MFERIGAEYGMLPSYEELGDYDDIEQQPDRRHSDNDQGDGQDDYDLAHADVEHGHLQTVWEALDVVQDKATMADSLAEHLRTALDQGVDAWVDQHDVAMTFREIRAAVDDAMARILSDRDVAFDLASHVYKKLA